MTRISVELVPRDIEVLKEEVKTIKEKLSDVDFINIPDLFEVVILEVGTEQILQKLISMM